MTPITRRLALATLVAGAGLFFVHPPSATSASAPDPAEEAWSAFQSSAASAQAWRAYVDIPDRHGTWQATLHAQRGFRVTLDPTHDGSERYTLHNLRLYRTYTGQPAELVPGGRPLRALVTALEGGFEGLAQKWQAPPAELVAPGTGRYWRQIRVPALGPGGFVYVAVSAAGEPTHLALSSGLGDRVIHLRAVEFDAPLPQNWFRFNRPATRWDALWWQQHDGPRHTCLR